MKRRALVLAVALVGCPEENPPLVCTDAIDAATCTPAYDPTFANVFGETLAPSCGIGGAACHTARGRNGGLVFEEIDESYRLINERAVRPGDPSCSSVMVRVTATDGNVRMPPGRSLPLGEQCAIAKWIAAGAQR